jgi:hypothetical protein
MSLKRSLLDKVFVKALRPLLRVTEVQEYGIAVLPWSSICLTYKGAMARPAIGIEIIH